MNVAVAVSIIIPGIGAVAATFDRYTRWIYRRGRASVLTEASQAKERERIATLETEISNLKAKLDSMLKRTIGMPDSDRRGVYGSEKIASRAGLAVCLVAVR